MGLRRRFPTAPRVISGGRLAVCFQLPQRLQLTLCYFDHVPGRGIARLVAVASGSVITPLALWLGQRGRLLVPCLLAAGNFGGACAPLPTRRTLVSKLCPAADRSHAEVLEVVRYRCSGFGNTLAE